MIRLDNAGKRSSPHCCRGSSLIESVHGSFSLNFIHLCFYLYYFLSSITFEFDCIRRLFSWNHSGFLIYSTMTINFQLRTALAVSQKYFHSKNLLSSPLISSVLLPVCFCVAVFRHQPSILGEKERDLKAGTQRQELNYKPWRSSACSALLSLLSSIAQVHSPTDGTMCVYS